MALVKIARVDEIPDNGMIMREHGGKQILLAKIDGQVHAIDDVCTHQGAPLHQGDLGREGRHFVTCPWHEAHFDLRDGKVHQDTDWGTDTECYRVEVREGEVWIDAGI
jgi:3-phenylpropionate/trans-cinnamate dioxygenase ferredoxin subunit